MSRTIPWLLVGAASGALATYAVFFSNAGFGGSAVSPGARLASDGADEHVGGASPPAYLEAYDSAAGIDDPETLERSLSRALAAPFSLQRDAEVGALFRRLAAIDVGRAIRMAELPGFDAAHLAAVIRGWAETDPDAAFKALGAVRGAGARRTIALALLEALGDGAQNIERIAAALPEFQRIDFMADAFARRAQFDPFDALGDVLSLRDLAARNTAAQRIGVEWARTDPIAAIGEAQRLPPEIRSAYLDVVSREWARLDAEGFFAYADAQSDITDLLQGMTRALAADPARVFEIARNHPPVPIENFGTLERIAFIVVAEQDPHHALEVLQTIRRPEPYNQMRGAVAEAWTRTRPAEALAWARSLDPPAPGVEATVIALTAILDVDQGLRLLEDFNPPANHPAVQAGVGTPVFVANNIGRLAAADPRRTEIANELLSRADDARAAMVLQRLTTSWVQTDPESALDWMLENGAALDPALAAGIAGQLASRDAVTAAAYAERMPPEFRNTWFRQVAPQYAQQDPRAAAVWIQQFQGEQGFDRVLASAVARAGQADPQSAARMLVGASPELQQQTASSVASAWAREDLAGAAQWAMGLDPAARAEAVSGVASLWAQRDSAAAQRWVTAMPAGDTRNRAATSVLSSALRSGAQIDRRLIQTVGAQAMQTVVQEALPSITWSDPERASALLDEWITDPNAKAQAQQVIESHRH